MKEWTYKPAADFGRSLAERAQDSQRENLWYETAIHFLWWSLVKLGLRLWNRIEIEGRENLPEEGPMVLVANHVSHIDCLALAAAVAPDRRAKITPMAAADVFFPNDFMSVLSSTVLNALPVRRTGKSCGLQAMRQYRKRLLQQEEIYILFPEGARSRDGEMKRFKGGIGILVAGTEVPVVPCYLEGAEHALAPGSHFIRPARIRLTIGKPVLFAETSNDREGWSEVAEVLETKVRALGRRSSAGVEAPFVPKPAFGWY